MKYNSRNTSSKNMSSRELCTSRGIILQQKPLKEADLIVTILFEDYGLLDCYAFSGKKSKIRFPGGLDLFDIGRFAFEKKNSVMPTLLGIHSRLPIFCIREDLQSLHTCMLATETLLGLSHVGDPSTQQYFIPLFKLLIELERKSKSQTELLKEFGEEVLEISGFYSVYQIQELCGFEIDDNSFGENKANRQVERIFYSLSKTIGKELQSLKGLLKN